MPEWTWSELSESERAREAAVDYTAMKDGSLLGAMRTGSPYALAEFMRRFQLVVVLQARRWRIPPHDRRPWVADVLYDSARTLCRSQEPYRGSLAAYVLRACRNRAISARRDRQARERGDLHSYEATGALEERVLGSVCSESTLRATYAADWEPAPLPVVLERLVSALDEGLSPDERQLLSWLGQRVPYTTIARWLGVTRSAAVKRATRLRARLFEVAIRFGEGLAGEERLELRRFFRRTGAVAEDVLPGGERSRPTRAEIRRRHPERRNAARTMTGGDDDDA